MTPSPLSPQAALAVLTLDEKVRLVVGEDLYYTIAIPRIGLRPMFMCDGPTGVRHPDGGSSSQFPQPTALGATWDPGLARRVGAAYASVSRRHGVDVLLAPQINLQRTPVGGRHFECYSEDPLLTAVVTAPLVTGAQERGVALCTKHYVANDSETQRTSYVSRVSERALREVYLPPFEAHVAAGTWSVMGAYNGIDDGVESAQALDHTRLLRGVLKDEWGYDGLVVSDWLATRSVVGAVRGGLDLQMPGPDGPWGDGLAAAVAEGQVTEAELDEKVLRILRLAQRVGALGAGPAPVGDVDVDGILREWVARSLVVLKDDDGLLPLAAPARVALVGPNAVAPFLGGGGSSLVPPERVVTLADAVAAAFPGAAVELHAGAVSRFVTPALDLSAATTPDGLPGVHAQLLGADGAVLREWTATEWDDDVPDLPDAAVALRLRTRVPLPEPGAHRVGVATVGAHRVLLGGSVASASDVLADHEAVLTSAWTHPPVTMVPVEGPTVLDVDATVQVVHPTGYPTFLRLRPRHEVAAPEPARLRAEAVAAAAAADVAVVVVGTNEENESEGWDRTTLALPGDQDELVRAVLAVQPRTVVVVNAGAPVLLPWLGEARCVVWGWLGGQAWAEGLAGALSGVAEPAGRLPWTLPGRAEDVPVPDAVPVDGVVAYTDDVHVGYRSWDLLGREPAAPFGHGLGWTSWEYRAAQVRPGPGGPVVAVTVANTGARRGREVVQAYLEPPAGTRRGERPVRWLAGFAAVEADPGEQAVVDVPLHPYATRAWDVARSAWVTPAGRHRVRVGRSSRDLRLDAEVVLAAPDTQGLDGAS